MWETIPWLVVLLSTTRGNVFLINNGVQTSTANPYTAADRPTVGVNQGQEIAPIPEQDTTNVILTAHGEVRGYEMKDNTKIIQFLDIPYAAFDEKNPFQEPTQPKPWENVREITEHNSRCPQLNSESVYIGTPDCLTLSVFVPKEAKNAGVLFHIHDGGFVRGSGDPRVYGPGYLVPENVLLILPNYRLGPLGFLCLQNITAPGNAGLKDLTMALNWTRQNIGAFGGNPSNIVVSGTGTGAALAQYLAVAPQSRDFVDKVITESGCILSHWAIDRNPIDTAHKFASILNDSEASNVFNTSLQRLITAADGLVFRPCVERQGFLNATPWTMLQDIKLNKSFMIGATDRPGRHKAMQHTEDSVSALNRDFRLLLPNDLSFRQREEEEKIGKMVKVQYFGNNTISLEHRNELALCHSDCSYLSPGIRSARLLTAAESTVYLYEFSYVNKAENSRTDNVQGADQGESLKYVFQAEEYTPVERAVTSETEKNEMINLMTNLWASFIQTGKPTSEGVEWEELKRSNFSDEAWLSIDTKTEMKWGFHLGRLSLWTDIYNEHFIEKNLASESKPGLIPAYLVLLTGLVMGLYQ